MSLKRFAVSTHSNDLETAQKVKVWEQKKTHEFAAAIASTAHTKRIEEETNKKTSGKKRKASVSEPLDKTLVYESAVNDSTKEIHGDSSPCISKPLVLHGCKDSQPNTMNSPIESSLEPPESKPCKKQKKLNGEPKKTSTKQIKISAKDRIKMDMSLTREVVAGLPNQTMIQRILSAIPNPSSHMTDSNPSAKLWELVDIYNTSMDVTSGQQSHQSSLICHLRATTSLFGDISSLDVDIEKHPLVQATLPHFVKGRKMGRPLPREVAFFQRVSESRPLGVHHIDDDHTIDAQVMPETLEVLTRSLGDMTQELFDTVLAYKFRTGDDSISNQSPCADVFNMRSNAHIMFFVGGPRELNIRDTTSNKSLVLHVSTNDVLVYNSAAMSSCKVGIKKREGSVPMIFRFEIGVSNGSFTKSATSSTETASTSHPTLEYKTSLTDSSVPTSTSFGGFGGFGGFGSNGGGVAAASTAVMNGGVGGFGGYGGFGGFSGYGGFSN